MAKPQAKVRRLPSIGWPASSVVSVDVRPASRSSVLFATRENGWLNFRLRPEIAAAALRTPDTAVSSRGREWVSLAPAALDSFALDRATAWFEVAWRLAGESAAPGAAPN